VLSYSTDGLLAHDNQLQHLSQILLPNTLLSSIIITINNNSSNSINPSSQSDPRPRNLQLHNRRRALVILSPAQIVLLHPVQARRENVLANERIGLRRPLDPAFVWVGEIGAFVC